jgi:hypothetical protein
MGKPVVLILALVTFHLVVQAQNQGTYRLFHKEYQDRVYLNVSAKTASYQIKAAEGNHHLINLFPPSSSSTYSHPVNSDNSVNGIRQIFLSLDENNKSNSSLSNRFLQVIDSNDEEASPWGISLSNAVPFHLDLNYGMGDATFNLSGLAISKLKVNTGSADVALDYPDGTGNKTTMDTLLAEVDLGSLSLNCLNHTRAKEVIANVGFGSLLLHVTPENTGTCHVSASVGAGNLVVKLANSSIPVYIRFSGSPLCRIKVPAFLKQIDENIYINDAYEANINSAIRFDIDVAMGQVIFQLEN